MKMPREKKKMISQDELNEKIALHGLWLKTRDTQDVKGEQLILEKYDLTGCTIINENLVNSNMRGCILNKAILNGTNFANAILDGNDFNGIMAVSTNFENTSMRHCFFRGARLFYSNLKNANMSWSSFQYCDFANANLEGTIFMNAFLYNSKNKDLTKSILNKNV